MTSSRVYFGRLAKDTKEEDLVDLVKSYGKYRNLRLLQGFAFLEFDDIQDAQDCCKDLDGTSFLGEKF